MPQEIKNTLDFSNEGFIVNIPDGVNDQDAVNVRQLNSAILNGISGASGKYLISGGAVWSGTGLTYNTSYISFFWNGNKLASPTSLTLATSDPTNNRLDAIVVDESETVSVIAGVASASPITPAIPEDQLLVQFILVEAGTTVPAITQENIYLDNAEWTFANYTTSGSQVGTSNPNATNSPKEGTKCIDNSLGPLSGIRFSRATSLDLTPYTTFAMWIRIPASIDSKETLIARFENSSFAPIGNQVDLFSFGIQKTVLGTWQLAIVPVSAFGVSTVKGFRLIMTGGKSNVQVKWDADFITLTNGSTPVTISPNINFYKNSTIVGSQKGLDLVEGVGMGITAVIDPLKATVKYTLTPDTNKAYVDAADAGKIDKNTAITGATKTKITYDAKGLVTSGADATTADITDSVDKRYVTDAELTVIANTSGINTGDQVVPVKAAYSELNTGTDDAKFATSLALEGSKYLNQSGSKISATASGTDTYTATIAPAITAYSSTQRWFIKFTNANTGPATLNLNILGAIAIKKTATSALAAGDIVAGQILCLAYDGTNFQIIGGSGSGGGGTWGSITGTLSSQTDLQSALNAKAANILTGYVKGSGVVAATDSVLQAIQKLDGNDDVLQSEINAVNPVGNKLFNYYNFI